MNSSSDRSDVWPRPFQRGAFLAARILVGLLLYAVTVVAFFAAAPFSRGLLNRALGGGFPREFKAIRLDLWQAGISALAMVAIIAWLRRSASQRGFKAVVSFGVLALANLFVYAYVAPRPYDYTGWARLSGAADLTGLVLIVFVVPILTVAAVRHLSRWSRLSVTLVILGAMVGYLVKDDPRPVYVPKLQDISPPFPGAQVSFDVAMRYAKGRPLATKFREPQRMWKRRFVSNKDPVKWAAWLTESREAIMLDWADLKPVRDWFDEMNRFDQIGDLTPARWDAEIMGFTPVRAYTQHARAMAGLLALDGKGDEAIACLLPLAGVGRKLEPSSRTLVRSMLARIMQREAISAARFVIARTSVSPEMRRRLAQALAIGIAGGEGARHLMATDGAFATEVLAEPGLGHYFGFHGEGGPGEAINAAACILYNPNRTLNAFVDFSAGLQAAAARRDLKGFAQIDRQFSQYANQGHFKNLLGWYLLGISTPAYRTVLESYWQTEDSRLALIDRLAHS